MPRDLNEGDTIMSGCINLSGVVRVRATKSFGESTVYKIIALVESADKNKSKSEAFITRFARVYTPIVVFAAIALAVIPPFLATTGIVGEGTFGENFPLWLNRALIFLVVSCPCALVISVPLTFFWRHRWSFPERYSHQGQQLYGCFSQGGNRCVRQNRNSDPRRVCRSSCSC